MKPRSVKAALNQVLEPLGFSLNGSDWKRHVGDVEEVIYLQKSNTLGLTVNILSVDLVSRQMLRDAVPPGSPALTYWVDVRISELMGPYDRWWRADPNAVEEIPELVRTLALPYLEKMRSPEEQAIHFGRRAIGQPNPHVPSTLWLAITLYRMGEKEEACRALIIPKRRTEIPAWAAQVQPLRAYLGCPHMDGLAGS